MNPAAVWAVVLGGLAVVAVRAADEPRSPATVPDLTLLTPTREEFKLAPAFRGRPGLLFFYPGGWHPQSVKVLKDLRNAEEELTRLQCRIVALTPDRPERIHETLGEHSLPFVILHDSGAAAARVFGITRRIEEEEIRDKAAYGLDLRERTASMDVHLPRLTICWINDRGEILKTDVLEELQIGKLEKHLVSRGRWLGSKPAAE